jgi:hypothetical protein
VKLDRERFDYGFDRKADRRAEAEPREPVITSKRGPRFVAYTFCFHCFFARVGIVAQGQLRDGTKVYELASHSQGAGSHRSGKPLCFGAYKRIEATTDPASGETTWRRVL